MAERAGRLGRKEMQLSKGHMKHTLVAPLPPPHRFIYSTADGVQQVAHGSAVCVHACMVKNTLTLTLAQTLLT